MTMAIHEALEILDPKEQTPHDMYAILTYAAAAHPDVAQMMDRFARLHRSRVIGEQQQCEAAAAMGAEPRLVPLIPAPPPVPKKRRTGRPHGSYTRPKEVIEAERAEVEAKRVEFRAKREAQQAQKILEVRKKKEEREKDKEFTYLVRRAEQELGWTGKYDNEVKPKPKPASTYAKRKKDWYYYKASDVKDTLMWMMNQLIKDISEVTRPIGSGVVVVQATYGTKKNALVAMRGITQAVLVDKSDIGKQIRDNWFDGLQDAFKGALDMLSDEEIATLRKEKRLIKDLRALLRNVREKELDDSTLKEVFSVVAPMAGDGEALSSGESELSEDEDEVTIDEEGSHGDEPSKAENGDGDSEIEIESSDEEDMSNEESSSEEE